MGVNNTSNLQCPNCDEQFSSLTISNRVDELDLSKKSLRCSSCWEESYPEDALLNHINSTKDDGLFGVPLSIGGHGALGIDFIEVGQTTEHDSVSLVEGAVIDSIHLLGARKGDEQEFDFEIKDVASSLTSFSLEDAVLISVMPKNGGSGILFSSALRDEDQSDFEFGDRIDVKYRYVIAIPGIQNPPWVDLLREAETAIRKGNTVSSLPLLISAFQNHLFRQASLTIREKGLNDRQVRRILEHHSGRKRLKWRPIAKEGLESIAGKRLSHHDYQEEWQKYDDLRHFRDDIVHPNITDEVDELSREDAIEYFAATMELMLDVYEICEQAR